MTIISKYCCKQLKGNNKILHVPKMWQHERLQVKKITTSFAE
jgi:hypothetical protein